MKRALVVFGGWEGHFPVEVGQLFRGWLEADGFQVELSDTLDSFQHASDFDLIVPHWTMGEVQPSLATAVLNAVEMGTGIAGCHGGMGDSFRNSTDWQFLVGGQFVAHPGNDGLLYQVSLNKHEITYGLNDFEVASEQYYMHVDPAVEVLASTRFPVAPGPHEPNGAVEMPVIWTKRFGKGKVFYCSLGHHPLVLMAHPVETLMRRGFLWASR